jgi:hypothetical protein
MSHTEADLMQLGGVLLLPWLDKSQRDTYPLECLL